MEPPFLKQGALAPAFSLATSDGQTITRSQYRNKAGLLLIFVPSPSDPAVAPLLEQVAQNIDAYQKLKAKVYVIARTNGSSPLPVLLDLNGAVWHTYSGLSEPSYGIFVLDKYGGVDTQIVGTMSAVLPDATTLYEWMQSTMYKCSI